MQPDSDRLSDSYPLETDDLLSTDLINRPTTSDLFDTWARTETNDETLDNTAMAQQLRQIVKTPEINREHYLADTDFEPIYSFKTQGKLTGDDNIDRKTLLINDNYYIQDDLLYKISLPRNKKQNRVRNVFHQLCVPRPYRSEIITEYHKFLGHTSHSRLYGVLIVSFYWPQILTDIKNKLLTCETCQLSKVSTRPIKAPLYPIPIPQRPWSLASMDHKCLPRKSNQGNTHVLFLCVKLLHVLAELTFCYRTKERVICLCFSQQ